jgi:SOS-response transcriptional repressor LexA
MCSRSKSHNVIPTVLKFESEIRPESIETMHVSLAKVLTPKGWIERPYAKVGLFKAQHLFADCGGLILLMIENEIAVASQTSERPPGKYKQFPNQYRVSVETFSAGNPGSGIRLDPCFPEHIILTVENPSKETQRFAMDVHGASLLDWMKR